MAYAAIDIIIDDTREDALAAITKPNEYNIKIYLINNAARVFQRKNDTESLLVLFGRILDFKLLLLSETMENRKRHIDFIEYFLDIEKNIICSKSIDDFYIDYMHNLMDSIQFSSNNERKILTEAFEFFVANKTKKSIFRLIDVILECNLSVYDCDNMMNCARRLAYHFFRIL